MKRSLFFGTILAFCLAHLGYGQVPPTINYQGLLTDQQTGEALAGPVQLTFRLYLNIDDLQVDASWIETHTNVPLNNGVFQVILGSNTPLDLKFDAPYYLGVEVGAEEVLPRQALTSVAYALNAREVYGTSNVFPASGKVGIGTVTPDQMLTVAGTVQSTSGGFKFPDGSVQATAVTGGEADWSLTGNSGTTPGTNFLGTTDSQPLELHVNNARALRLEPNSSPNVIGGYSGNTVTGGLYGATIGGGGSSGADVNQVTANYGTVSGGTGNTASGEYATVGGGDGNSANNNWATVSGGGGNDATDAGATVGGGLYNKASGIIATVGGGAQNQAKGAYAIVPGGLNNIAGGSFSFAAGCYAFADHG